MLNHRYPTLESKGRARRSNTGAAPFDDLASAYDAWFEREGKSIFAVEVQAFQEVLPSLPRPWLRAGFFIEKVISTLFQHPGKVKRMELPQRGYSSSGGFTVIVAGKHAGTASESSIGE